MSLKRSIIVAIILTLVSVQQANSAAKNKEASPINPDTLTGGIVRNDGYYLPRGFKIEGELRTPLDTRINEESDMVTMQTTEDIMIGDYTIIPANSFLHGYIKELKAPGKWHKAAKVELAFETISLPGQSGKRRRHIPIQGRVRKVELNQKSKAVQASEQGLAFKKKAMAAAGAGAAVGGTIGWAFTELVEPFGALAIEGIADRLILGGTALGGAYLASSMIKKDDMRIEPGTKLQVFLDEPTFESFDELHPLSHNNVKDLSPAEAYDKYNELQSESLIPIN